MTSKAPTYLFRYGILALLVWVVAGCAARHDTSMYDNCCYSDAVSQASEVDTVRHRFKIIPMLLCAEDSFTTRMYIAQCHWDKKTLYAEGITMDCRFRKRNRMWLPDTLMPGAPVLHCAKGSVFGDSLIHVLDTLCVSDAQGRFAFSLKRSYPREYILVPQSAKHFAMWYDVQEDFIRMLQEKDTRQLAAAIVQLRHSLSQAGYTPVNNILGRLLNETERSLEERCIIVAGFLQGMEDRMPELRPLLAKPQRTLERICRKYDYRLSRFSKGNLNAWAGEDIDTVIARMRGKH